MSAAEVPVDLHVWQDDDVWVVELRRPPYNHFDLDLIGKVADALEKADATAGCRAVVLCAQGKAFCAGADFAAGSHETLTTVDTPIHPLYEKALRIFSCRKPIVAAVHGAAVGGGLGLALAADFRVTCAEARYCANFARLGIHAGFGLSVTLPRVAGAQFAALMMCTGRRIDGAEAVARGVADVLVPQSQVRAGAMQLAREIAVSSPDAVVSMRSTLRRGLVDQLREAMTRETREQRRQFRSADFREGVAATADRRLPRFSDLTVMPPAA